MADTKADEPVPVSFIVSVLPAFDDKETQRLVCLINLIERIKTEVGAEPLKRMLEYALKRVDAEIIRNEFY